MSAHALGLLGGYLLGSIPFGYLLVRLHSRIDIRQAGSGNVGGFNAFIVTNSRFTGVLVGLIDGLKGVAAAAIPLLMGADYRVIALAIIGAILGHNYPLWLRFKGGRGLATACGGLMIAGFAYTIVWVFLWVLSKVQLKDILRANILASVMTPLILIVLPDGFVELSFFLPIMADEYRILSFLLTLVFLISHWKPLLGIFRKQETKDN